MYVVKYIGMSSNSNKSIESDRGIGIDDVKIDLKDKDPSSKLTDLKVEACSAISEWVKHHFNQKTHSAVAVGYLTGEFAIALRKLRDFIEEINENTDLATFNVVDNGTETQVFNSKPIEKIDYYLAILVKNLKNKDAIKIENGGEDQYVQVIKTSDGKELNTPVKFIRYILGIPIKHGGKKTRRIPKRKKRHVGRRTRSKSRKQRVV